MTTPALGVGHLWLEPLRVDHAAELVDVRSDAGLYTFTGDPDEVWQNWVVRLEDGGPVVGYVQATRHLSAGSAELAWVVGAPPAPPEPSAAGRAAYCALGSAERRPLDIRLPLRRARR